MAVMEYRPFGRTGVRVSPLCLGTMTYDDERTSKNEAFAIVDAALDAGINFLDTANIYAKGRGEEIVGEALQRDGKRDRVILATKVHGRMHADQPHRYGNSRCEIIEQCHASLRRLKTDWIDLYQIHRPEPSTPIDETLRALDDLVRAGKVRYLGTSTFAAWQILEALWCSKELRLNRFVCEQPPYNLLDRRIEREVVPMALTYGIALIPWSPLGGGYLTGKYRRGSQPAEGRWTGARIGPNNQPLTSRAYDVIETVAAIAQEKGCTPGQVALAWTMNRPGITSPIIGPRTLDQFRDNLGALGIALTDDDNRRLEAATPPGLTCFDGPWFGESFGPHPHRW